jgi:hypothetical protein
MVNNTWLDEMKYVPANTPGIIVEGRNGGSTDWTSADIYTQLGVTAGTFKPGAGGEYLVNTPIQFGINDTSTHGFTDTNKTWIFEDHEFVAPDFYKLSALGNSGGTTNVTFGAKTGTGDDATGAQGLTIQAEATGARWSMDFNDANLDAIGFYGCSFLHGNEFQLNDAAVEVISTTYVDGTYATITNSLQQRCGIIDANTDDQDAAEVWYEDVGTSWSEQTSGFNDATDANWTVFPASEAIGDYCAIGSTSVFNKLTLDNANGTAGVGGSVVIVWEYWNGSAWTALAGVVDGTSNFTATASDGQIVEWTMPSDWEATSVGDGATGGAELFCVRARITAATYTTNPIYDQGQLGCVSFMLTDDLGDIKYTAFEFSGGHAVEMTTPRVAAQNSTGNSFTGYGSTGTINASIYNDTAGLVDISAVDSPSAPTYRNGASATTTSTLAVTVTITIKDGAGVVVENARVAIYTDDASETELMNELTTVSGIATEPYSDTVPRAVFIRVRAVTGFSPAYRDVEQPATITSDGLTATITLEEDPNVN